MSIVAKIPKNLILEGRKTNVNMCLRSSKRYWNIAVMERREKEGSGDKREPGNKEMSICQQELFSKMLF